MIELTSVPQLDKNQLLEKIKENFINIDSFLYKRAIQEIFLPDGTFLGDNFVETSFKVIPGESPEIFEISGPYDTVSKTYSMTVRKWKDSKLILQLDMKPGILQRTAAIVILYFQALKHTPNKILIYGPGKVSTANLSYIKHYYPDILEIDYSHYSEAKPLFEKAVYECGIKANFVSTPILSLYDTIIMATNTKQHIVTLNNFTDIKPGTVLVSQGTSSPISEIEPILYGKDNVAVYLDYELTRTFLTDTREINEMGYFDKAVYLADILHGKTNPDIKGNVNILRLTGSPMQNVAVVDLTL